MFHPVLAKYSTCCPRSLFSVQDDLVTVLHFKKMEGPFVLLDSLYQIRHAADLSPFSAGYDLPLHILNELFVSIANL